MKKLLLAALLFAASWSHAAVESLDAFARLPVQEGGRVMPMDSYARQRLLQFSGKSTLDKRPAIEWLARLFFTPTNASEDVVFLVNNPEVLEAMRLTVTEGRRFSFSQLEPGLSRLQELAHKASEIESKERTALENEIVRLYHSLNGYVALMHGLGFALPSEDFSVTNPAARALLGLEPDQTRLSFLDIFLKGERLSPEVEVISKKEPGTWTADDKAIFDLSAALFQWSQFYRGLPPSIIPIHGHGQGQWIGPWDVLSMGFASDEIRAELVALKDMGLAYSEGRQADFNLAATWFERSVKTRNAEERAWGTISLELLFNRLQPFARAEMLYGFAFVLGLIYMLAEKTWIRRASVILVLLALIPHTFGIVARMMIMGRPPVTNLYATFLFVAWVCVLLGLILEFFQRNALGSFLAGVAGLSLLLLSRRFAVEGDTLGVMIAVLDSNFWLSTHVVAITIGYAGCVASGLAGHVYLLQALRNPPDSPKLVASSRAVYGLMAFGLIFSFLGTMLGGVWADQSWGRFWGWDPKENGALLIVLWCSLLFHARISKLIGPRGMAAGSVLGVIVVLLAWLGINLLGVGLHSYGFTSGLALGMWITMAVEIGFVLFTAPFAKRAIEPVADGA